MAAVGHLIPRGGADTLLGGLGADTLIGGTGTGTFVWRNTNETGVTIATAGVIQDFNFAEGNRIDLSQVDADVYAIGNQAFTFIGDDSFSGTPGEINYVHLTATPSSRCRPAPRATSRAAL